MNFDQMPDYVVLEYLTRLNDKDLLDMCAPPLSKKIQRVCLMDGTIQERIKNYYPNLFKQNEKLHNEIPPFIPHLKNPELRALAIQNELITEEDTLSRRELIQMLLKFYKISPRLNETSWKNFKMTETLPSDVDHDFKIFAKDPDTRILLRHPEETLEYLYEVAFADGRFNFPDPDEDWDFFLKVLKSYRDKSLNLIPGLAFIVSHGGSDGIDNLKLLMEQLKNREELVLGEDADKWDEWADINYDSTEE